MKNNFASKKAEPVPSRVRWIAILGCALLLATSVVAGRALTPEEEEIPVVLADGSVITPPWYITIDGQKVALVASREAAEETLQKVIETYGQSDDTLVLDIEIKEETKTEQMELENGDQPPEILTTTQACRKILEGEDGDGYLTVVTTEEQRSEETIEFQKEYKVEPELYVGETKIETEGKEGTKEVTKKVVKENGDPVEEEIVDEEVLEEPQEQVVLTGIKGYDGIGGGESAYDETDLSYDLSATYKTLRTPVDQVYVSSGFGARWGRNHCGVDLALAQGSPIYAADGGEVYFSGYGGGYGNLVKIDHGNGMQTYYAHCSRLLVSQGEKVKRGEKIALVGSTGNSTGPHLHFEVIINRACVDPLDFLDF